ncbi:ABC transporter ATP-binding protein [Bradyrhizobium sp. LjRoot220]|uniref:ABC transporter ATP-binding protein n=1 Tax=Bradyrhizobium sp. LjRoot220 TaxID=3342284 RepID=UPI003ECDCAAD
MSQITLNNLTKQHGDVTAVDRVSLEIKQGEFIAFLGPSGCGKTTTLRMIAGLTMASEGNIYFGDRDVTYLPPYLRNAGLVFQGYALFPHMSVAQNVAFGLEMRKIDRTEGQRRVMEALALVKLDHLADRLPRQLSGGQQQRVALARAIVYEPDVLLLDEPLSALDAKLRHEVRSELKRLQSKLGLTTIFVTHDQDEALSVADRIVVMSAGKVEQVGTPRDIYQRPATRFVAEFIGLTNFIVGWVGAADCFHAAGGEKLVISAGCGSGITAVAIRPEQINLREREASGRDANSLANSLQVTVEEVTYRGALTEFVVKTNSGLQLIAHRQNDDMSRSAPPQPGDLMVASWPAAATIVF